MIQQIHNSRYFRFFIVTVLGFASGLPLSLTAKTLQAWFAVSHVDIMTIGLLGLLGQPYIFKFLWAPLMDRYHIPYLGRRRGWIIISQLSLVVAIAFLAGLSPKDDALLMAAVALLIAFLSASQDIAYDAFRTELLAEDERGLGAALGVWGYRIGMIFSGGLALNMANSVGFQLTYLAMAAAMFVGVFACYFAPEPDAMVDAPSSLRAAVVKPFINFLARPRAGLILLFIFLYKLAEAFTSSTSGSLVTTFLIRDLGFSVSVVGNVDQVVGMIATLVGLFIGGMLMLKIRLYSALFLFGVLQAITNLSFVLLAYVGKSLPMLVLAVSLDNISAGMGMAALVAFIMSLCDHRYTAAQFALLTTFSTLPRIIAGPMTATMLQYMSWLQFFVWSFVFALPALVVLLMLKQQVHSYQQVHQESLRFS